MNFELAVLIGFLMIMVGICLLGLSVLMNNDLGDEVFKVGIVSEILGLLFLGLSLGM
ncbi:MAG: hypothetical protein ACRCXX_11735 [Cetobacterium sp.]|uniref:hypothetical protein n=1 Tax=Cetobacterium sp. TaxID=2071632 RepID=UPI003F2CA80A